MKEGMTERTGFTIVELLTVMSVIAILIGLLVPALNLVKDNAKQLQQQAQFHSIEAGLEMFSTDFGYYPESNDNVDYYDTTKSNPANEGPYCGGNKLAEAMVGLDYLGVHPKTEFRPTGRATLIDPVNGAALPDEVVYNPLGGIPNIGETADANIKSRKGPYIEFENANAFRMDEVFAPANLTQGGFNATYQPPNGLANTTDTSFYPLVLCDVFAKKRSSAATAGAKKKTGMPILYYRAHTNFIQQKYDDTNGIADDIYYYPDNYDLLACGSADDPTAATLHPLEQVNGGAADLQNFEQMILNTSIQSIKRPYRAGSYILISAGKDGLYGTGDDVTNFNKEVQ